MKNSRLFPFFGGTFPSKPVADLYLNGLSPAIVKNHLTAGFGWKLKAHLFFDASFTYGFKVDAVNGSGASVSHSQTNAQVMYSYRF